mgnify:CR=1 FL=1
MDFSIIEGQKQITGILQRAVQNNQVAHAYIFSGPKGIGKRTVARIFARLLLCSSGNSGKACGECLPCRMMEAGTNPDYYVLAAEDASIGVDDIRNMQNNMAVRPMYSPRKVYLIEEADKMTVQAQNCLLKTLEEPPPYSVIILAASNYHVFLETVLSRAVKLDFKKYGPDEIKRAIYKKFGKYSEHTDFIISYSDGIIGTALMLEQSEAFAWLRERTIDVLINLTSQKSSYIFKAYDFFEENKEDIDIILDIFTSFYRDVYLAYTAGKDSILINSDRKDIIFNEFGNFVPSKLLKNIRIVEETRNNIRQNANFQLSIEVMLMKLQEE